jgi:hypothetical protein
VAVFCWHCVVQLYTGAVFFNRNIKKVVTIGYNNVKEQSVQCNGE